MIHFSTVFASFLFNIIHEVFFLVILAYINAVTSHEIDIWCDWVCISFACKPICERVCEDVRLAKTMNCCCIRFSLHCRRYPYHQYTYCYYSFSSCNLSFTNFAVYNDVVNKKNTKLSTFAYSYSLFLLYCLLFTPFVYIW